MSPTENETAVSTWSMQDTGRPSRLKGKGCTVTSFLNDCKSLTIVVIRRGLSPWPTALHSGALSDELILPCCKFQSDLSVFFFFGGGGNFWIWNWTIYKDLVWVAIISAFTGKLSTVIKQGTEFPPGQGCGLQWTFSVEEPTSLQSLPPYWGLGLIHSRFLVFIPPLHDLLHKDQSDHSE